MLFTGRRGRYEADLSRKREGGQAVVFPATGPDGTVVAVRVAKGGSWLPREARLLSRLGNDDTEWVVRVVDEGTDSAGRAFIVTPWYTMDLAQWLDQPGRTLAERLSALELACAAVARLHRAPDDLAAVLVHRDIKPNNFLVRDGSTGLVVVLADLGIAKEGMLLDTTQNTGAFTPRYSPPEQQLPIDMPPEPTIDVYGLGVTVFVGIAFREPHVSFVLATAWTALANRLVSLHAVGHRRSVEEEAEYRALRRQPLRDLVDIDDVPALFPRDEEALRTAISREGIDPEAVLSRLLPVLRRALDPDPARRLGDARMLVAACRNAREALGDVSALRHRPATQAAAASSGTLAPVSVGVSSTTAGGAETWAPEVGGAPESPPPSRAVSSSGARPGLRVAGALVAALVALGTTGFLCLGAGGLANSWWSTRVAAPAPNAASDAIPGADGAAPAVAATAAPGGESPAVVASRVPGEGPPTSTRGSTAPPSARSASAVVPDPVAESAVVPDPVAESAVEPPSPVATAPVAALSNPSLSIRCPKPFTIDGISVASGQPLPVVPGEHRVVVTAELARSWRVVVVHERDGWSVLATERATRNAQQVGSGGVVTLACDFEGGLSP